ncbi:WG repeat-containing protein [Solitalea lacus]|uniref:WG repeat-containing protein n=1 Tax=Solitalea lacus TaxID=2911172 RepID=UPI001EDA5533|nr:WG repeat-containing protein [Solitalea lacus]UKJ08513.1 WG repeat-containing protein [Solitalea lacus]
MKSLISAVVLLFLVSCQVATKNSKNNELFAYRDSHSGKTGYKNIKNEVIVKPRFSSGTTFSNNGYYIVTRGKVLSPYEKFAIIDGNGNFVINFSKGYQLISFCKNKELLKVIKADKYGYINFKNEVIIPIKFEQLSDVINGKIAAKENESSEEIYFDVKGKRIK